MPYHYRENRVDKCGYNSIRIQIQILIVFPGYLYEYEVEASDGYG